MGVIDSFRAVHCAGAFITDAKAITAMSLLFEKIFLPNNVELISEFAKKYRFQNPSSNILQVDIKGEGDPFPDLTETQRQTAKRFLQASALFLIFNRELVGPVFETSLLENNEVFDVKLVKKGAEGKKNLYSVKPKPLTLIAGDEDRVSTLVSTGYVPLATLTPLSNASRRPAREVACLLAMKSVEMALPAMREAKPEEILEARERLRDHLPLFWASMLRLSSELSKRIAQNARNEEIFHEAQDLVDTIVRPSAIELRKKLERERKGWFRRILGPAQQSLKFVLGRPSMTKQDLLTAALLLGSDVASTAVEKMRELHSLREDSGLTYLIELEKSISQ